MIQRIKNRFRDDSGMMTQSMLIMMMIPAILGAVTASLLMNMQVDRARELHAVNKDSADQLASLVLSDLNDGYPANYLNMSQDDLRAATTLINPTTGSQSYVSTFTADSGTGSENWTYIRITAQASKNAITAQDFTYKYRASTSIGYLGKNDNGRPIWASTATAGVPKLAIFEMVPESADKAKYPPAPWEAGQRPTEVLNPRIIRSIQYGVILVWNQPENSGPSELNGYELASMEPGATGACLWQTQDPGEYNGADGFIILNANIHAAKNEWSCNSNPAGSSMSIRGSSPNGLGSNLIVKLNDLTVTSDLFPPTPAAAKNLKLGTVQQTGSDTSWDAVTCDADSSAEYQFVWVKGASGTSPWQSEVAYRTTHPMGTELTWLISAKCVGAYNDSPSVNSEPYTFIAPTDPATNLRVVNRNATTADVAWNAVACPAGTAGKYRAVFNSLNNTSVSTSSWSTALTASVSTKAGDGFRWSVESRCDSTTTAIQSPAIGSPQVVLLIAPLTPTSLGTVGPPGATETTLTFSASTCAIGSLVEYLVSVSGNQPFTTTDTTPLITNPTGVSSATWTVAARCVYGTETSPYSATASGTIILTVQVPTAPTNLAANSTNSTASWTASTCPTPGSTPNYQFTWTSGATGTSSWFTTPSFAHGTRTQGTDLIWKVNVKCVITGSNPVRESAVVSSANGPKFYYAVTVPTGDFRSTHNSVSTMSNLTNTLQCGPGASLEYQAVRLKHGNDTAVFLSGWGTSSTISVPGGNWQGWSITARIEARCAVGTTVSARVLPPIENMYWVRGIATPAAATGLRLITANGVSNSLQWDPVGCPAGNTINYVVRFWDAYGTFDYWTETGGTTYWQRPLVSASASDFYYRVYARCLSQDPSIGRTVSSDSVSGILTW